MGVFYRVTYIVIRDICLYCNIRGTMTLTLFASSLECSSGAITAYFNDLVLSQLRFEHSNPAFVVNAQTDCANSCASTEARENGVLKSLEIMI